jgi:4'-phosphopantetheinyl transferase
MPLKHLQSEQGGVLVLWNILETKEELEELIRDSGRADLLPEPVFKAEKRNYEWMAARLALIAIAGREADIRYDDQGKPHPGTDDGHLSISHSWPYLCLYYHKACHVGVDIEQLSEKIRNISSKFVNEAESAWVKNQDEIRALYLIWAAKEAVFKMIGGGGIHFKEHLQLMPVEISNKGTAKILFMKGANTVFTIYYEFLDSMILVYTIAKSAETL